MADAKKSVLFICLGNICRSQIAEAVFRHMVEEKGLADRWEIDSAAIGDWHVGGHGDKRTLQCLKKYGIKTDHIVRQVNKRDFTKYDTIFGMDQENMDDLSGMRPQNATASCEKLGEYDPEGQLIIEDPYYGEYKDFETVKAQCDRCCKAFLEQNM